MQQEQQQKSDNAVMELRRQMLQNIEAVRAEAASELLTLRQNTLNGLVERVRTLEGTHAAADQDPPLTGCFEALGDLALAL